jgi:hypothetical protein
MIAESVCACKNQVWIEFLVEHMVALANPFIRVVRNDAAANSMLFCGCKSGCACNY